MVRRSRLSRHTFPHPSEGNRVSTPHFSLSFGSSREGGVAVVVSKKVARRSVDRHLLKRRIVEVLGPFSASDRFLVIYARSGSASLTFPVLREEIVSLLMKARISVAQ